MKSLNVVHTDVYTSYSDYPLISRLPGSGRSNRGNLCHSGGNNQSDFLSPGQIVELATTREEYRNEKLSKANRQVASCLSVET
jgi:hypothetical protein